VPAIFIQQVKVGTLSLCAPYMLGAPDRSTVIASEAKQSMPPEGRYGLVRR